MPVRTGAVSKVFALGGKCGGCYGYGEGSVTYLQGQKAPSRTVLNLTTSKTHTHTHKKKTNNIKKQRGWGEVKIKNFQGKLNNPCNVSANTVWVVVMVRQTNFCYIC